MVGRASHTLSLAPFTFHLSWKRFGEGFATRSSSFGKHTRKSYPANLYLGKQRGETFWGAFSIFKESRVRIDYCKICRGGGGIQRRKIGRSPRNDKNGVFLGETGRFGSRRENDRFDENSKTGWEEKGEETRYKRSANGGINALLRPSTA